MRTKTNKATTTASFWLSSLRKQPTFHDAITPRDITFEEWLQKFHTDDASLPRYGYCLWLVENLLGLIRSTTQIWVAMETCYQSSSVWNFCARSSNVISRGNRELVGSSPCSLSEESSPETDFIPEPCAETSRYGWKRKRVEKDNYVSWEKIVFWYINFSTTVNNLQGFW